MIGIPTLYKDRQYRSRLEARWAAMFDLLKWRYEYEPYDLRGWIPDFSLFGEDEILVEVKPFSSLAEFDTGKILKAIHDTPKWGKEILLLGCTISHSDLWGGPVVGWLGEYGYGKDGDDYWFEDAIFNQGGDGFFHAYGAYKDRITGLWEGDHYVCPPLYEDMLEIWNKAGNLTQWKPPTC